MAENTKEEIYDVIIIGSGVAGLSVGMYTGRFNLKTLILGTQPGGIITTTDLVENYPGIKSISGVDMGIVFMEHAQQFGAVIKNETVKSITRCPCPPTDGSDGSKENAKCAYKVETASGAYIGKTLVFATGTEYKKLGVPGEKEFAAKGVSYCALCDGAFFKEKEVVLVGGGDTAAIDSNILTQFCKKITVLVRKDKMKAEPINLKKMEESPKIEIRYNTEAAEILGKEKVTGVRLKNGEELKAEGVFLAIGHIPLSDLAKNLGVALDDHGYIKVNVGSETNLPGVYACGDITDKPFKQAIIGAAEGVMAAYFAYQYLQKNEVQYFCE